MSTSFTLISKIELINNSIHLSVSIDQNFISIFLMEEPKNVIPVFIKNIVSFSLLCLPSSLVKN